MSASAADKGKGKAQARDEVSPDTPLPHPAEDLSSDDDLLSWILVDQLGGMPNSKLGVHPQENKFVGPKFKTEEVLDITVVKGNLVAGCAQMQEFHLIAAHAKSKRTESQRERFIQHLRRYLLPYAPNSRVDIHTTNRYSHITLHPELAVYATRPLAPGTVLQELQGSVVELPEEWRKEMDLSDDFIEARLAAGEESEDELTDDDDETAVGEAGAKDSRRHGEAGPSTPSSRTGKGKGKEREPDRGARRSGRTRRRDFSIVWSELKRCYQLFLGPARFLNHDCTPNVELLRQGKYVTFRVTRPVRIGDELTTTYGADYFGPDNVECLCLSCELAQRGPYAPKASTSSTTTRNRSEDSRSATPSTPVKSKMFKPSKLRESILTHSDSLIAAESPAPADDQASETVAESSLAGSKAADGENDEPPTVASDVDELDSDAESDTPEPVKRERLSRAAKLNKPFNFHRRQPSASGKGSSGDSSSAYGGLVMHHPDDDLPEDFPRCATCASALHERMWWGGRYFDHCPRCTRHAFIFSLPWPAHKSNEVQEYPPSHLIPPNYVPVRISTVPLPSLTKKRIMPVATADPSLAEDGMLPVTREYRAQLRLRKEIALEEFQVEALREAAWASDMAYQEGLDMARMQQEARLEEKRLAREAKKARDAEKVKGSGLWSRYVYITEEEVQRREQERNALTLGTRRGGRYKREDMEGTPEREMREVREAMRKEWDEEEKAVGKLRMESWKEEQAVEMEVHRTPKKKALAKVDITPQVKAKSTAEAPNTAPVSKPARRSTAGQVHPRGAERKNTKAARTARTAAASAARRKSLPNPSSSEITPFVAGIAAAATRPNGKTAAKYKGKGKARAVSEGDQSDADTIADVTDLIDTGRPTKKQRDSVASRSPERAGPSKVTTKAGPLGTFQSTFRISLPGKRLAPGAPALPESSAAASGVNGAYRPKQMHPGQAVLRLDSSASAKQTAKSSAKGKGKARDDVYDGETDSSEGMRRSVSAALEAIDRSRSDTPFDERRGNTSRGEGSGSGSNTGLGPGMSGSTSTVLPDHTTEVVSPIAIGNKRKRKSQSRAEHAPSTPLTSLTASPVKAVGTGGSDSETQLKAPAAKRGRGRPRGSGHLQKRAAAQAEKEKAEAKRALDEKKEARRQKRNEYVRVHRAKKKAELAASLARSASGTAAGEDESLTATTAATLVSETMPGDVSQDDDDYMSDNSAVLIPARRIGGKSSAAAGVSAGVTMGTTKGKGPVIGGGKNRHSHGATERKAQRAAALPVWTIPSRTPSPFLRRSSLDDGPEGIQAPNPPNLGGRERRNGEEDQARGTHIAYDDGDDDEYEDVDEDWEAYRYSQPPSPRLAPTTSYTAPVLGLPLRMAHYVPDAPEANSKGWVVEPGAQAEHVDEDGDGTGNGGRRRSIRRANINYTSHRQLIRESLGNVALGPDHRSPASQRIRGAHDSASGSAGSALLSTATNNAPQGYPMQRPHRAYMPKTIVPYSYSH